MTSSPTNSRTGETIATFSVVALVALLAVAVVSKANAHIESVTGSGWSAAKRSCDSAVKVAKEKARSEAYDKHDHKPSALHLCHTDFNGCRQETAFSFDSRGRLTSIFDARLTLKYCLNDDHDPTSHVHNSSNRNWYNRPE